MIDETIFDQVRSIMAEHAHCWGFVMIDEDGDFYSDATNPIVGEMVFDRALRDYKDYEWSDTEVVLDDDDEGEEWRYE
jgi:hypothetical protein